MEPPAHINGKSADLGQISIFFFTDKKGTEPGAKPFDNCDVEGGKTVYRQREREKCSYTCALEKTNLTTAMGRAFIDNWNFENKQRSLLRTEQSSNWNESVQTVL